MCAECTVDPGPIIATVGPAVARSGKSKSAGIGSLSEHQFVLLRAFFVGVLPPFSQHTAILQFCVSPSLSASTS